MFSSACWERSQGGPKAGTQPRRFRCIHSYSGSLVLSWLSLSRLISSSCSLILSRPNDKHLAQSQRQKNSLFSAEHIQWFGKAPTNTETHRKHYLTSWSYTYPPQLKHKHPNIKTFDFQKTLEDVLLLALYSARSN